MNFIAWQMLTCDRAKYAGLVFAIAFPTFLMSHQMSIFVGLLNRAQSQIKDIADAGVWIMDPKTAYLDEVRAPYGEISQTSIKCTLLRSFGLELRPSIGRFQMERDQNPRGSGCEAPISRLIRQLFRE